MGEARAKGPLDWVRTDDENMSQGLYIQLLTRGLYPVIDALRKALEYEAAASATQKAEYHPAWLRNAEFCKRASELLAEVAQSLQDEWPGGSDDELPSSALRKDAVPGAIYPLPGGGIYIPKR